MKDFFRDLVYHHSSDPEKEFKSREFRERISKIAKEEIDIYMSEITDEYQNSDEYDSYWLETSFSDKALSILKLSYHKLVVKYEDVEDFIKKVDKVLKILKNKYDLDSILHWNSVGIPPKDGSL